MSNSYFPEDRPVSSSLSFADLIQGVWLVAYGFGYSALGLCLWVLSFGLCILRLLAEASHLTCLASHPPKY